MPKLKFSFTLIELIVVVILMGVVYFIVLSNYSKQHLPFIKITQLYNTLPKNCKFIVFQDSNNIELIHNKKYNFHIKDPHLFKIVNNELENIKLPYYKNKQIIFEYIKHNNIQNSYILKSNEGVFLFTPFKIIKTDSLENAKELFLNEKFLPSDGNYYK